MAPPEQKAERSRDLERLLTFVDAIAAVAITLLVLPLVDLAGEITSPHDSVWHVITSHSGRFWAFALSFIVIARLWLFQHQVLQPVIASSRALVNWLVYWSLAIVFLPFPTALLPGAGEQTATKAIYVGALIVSTVCLAGITVVVSRNRSLRDTDDGPHVANAMVNIFLLTLAFVIMVAIPATGYYPLFLLLLDNVVATAYHRLRGR